MYNEKKTNVETRFRVQLCLVLKVGLDWATLLPTWSSSLRLP